MTSTRISASDRTPWRATLFLSTLAFIWMEWVAVTRFLGGRWYLADVGNIHYALANTLRGAFMYSPMVEANHFGYHFTPFLLLLAPFTALSDYPVPLVTSYTLALALCPLALFNVARNTGLPGWTSAAVGVLFLGNIFVGSIQLADHFESWYVLFMLATMAFAPTGGWRFWTCAVLALSVKEDAAAWMIAYAGFLWWRARPSPATQLRRRALILAGAGIFWLLLAGIVMWTVGSGQAEGAASYLERAGGIRLGWDTLTTLVALFASTGFLALFGGASTVLALVPAPFLLPEFPFTRNLLYYYSYPFIPFLMLAAVEGLARIRNWLLCLRLTQRWIAASLALFTAAVGLVQLPMATRSDGNRRFPIEVTSRDLYRLQVAREHLPADAPVALQFSLWGITPTHPSAKKLSQENLRPEAYVFLDLKSPYGMPQPEYLELARTVMDDVQSGKRRLLHERGELYVVSPESNPAGN